MKVIQIIIEGDKEFTCKVSTDNLEDSTQLEQEVSDEIEGLIHGLMEELADRFKKKLKIKKL